MTASLYQRGSSSGGETEEVAASIGSAKFGVSSAIVVVRRAVQPSLEWKPRACPSGPPQVEYVSLSHAGIEPHVVPPAPPAVCVVVEQVAHRVQPIVIVHVRRFHPSVLHVVRIEVDDHKERLAVVRRPFAVRDELVVIRRMK